VKPGPKAPPTLTELPYLGEKWTRPSERVTNFFRYHLTHVKGELAGQPLILADWQVQDIVKPLFDTRNADLMRTIRTCYVEVPRKNAKSTIGAGLALYLLFADDEPGAEIVSAAADRDQAAIVFDIAKSMVGASPILSAMAKIYRREIVVPAPTGESVYRVISSEAYSKHGYNLHGAIIDEVHAHQDGGELYGVLTKGMGSRRQPVTFAITTAGHDRTETSLCWQLHQRALRVKAGLAIDPSFLGVVYAAPEEADWTDRRVWAIANPGLGLTVKEAFLEQECLRAQDMPAYENEFRQYHLDQWTESIKSWLPLSKWDRGRTPVDREALRGRRCFAGLDMATNTDLAALVLAFPDDETTAATYDILVHAWCPTDGIRRRAQKDHAPYDVWAREGFLEPTEGDAVDQETIRERILEYAAEFQIVELGYDDWNMGYLGPKLLADGINMRPIRQTFKALSGATKLLERCVLKRALRHGGHPVLRWCIANTVIAKDGPENIKPSKEKSPERIDLTVALVMALDCASRSQGPSAYEARGVLVL
jgi:phage terminase large subunit-like protein